MSAVVYDEGYDTRMIKTRKNMVTVWLLAAIKNDIDRPKISKFQSTLPYFSSESQPMHTISLATTVSNLF